MPTGYYHECGSSRTRNRRCQLGHGSTGAPCCSRTHMVGMPCLFHRLTFIFEGSEMPPSICATLQSNKSALWLSHPPSQYCRDRYNKRKSPSLRPWSTLLGRLVRNRTASHLPYRPSSIYVIIRDTSFTASHIVAFYWTFPLYIMCGVSSYLYAQTWFDVDHRVDHHAHTWRIAF